MTIGEVEIKVDDIGRISSMICAAETKFRVGDRVCGLFGDNGTIVDILLIYNGHQEYKVEQNGVGYCVLEPYLRFNEQIPPIRGLAAWVESDQHAPNCECGSASVGSPKHSTYCPLYRQDA
jgi:hypothetical protein